MFLLMWVDSFVQDNFLTILVLKLCIYGIILERFEISRSVCLSQILIVAYIFPSVWEGCVSSWVPIYNRRLVIIEGI